MFGAATSRRPSAGSWCWAHRSGTPTSFKPGLTRDFRKNALVPRYEVRPCMLALYFLGETSKVFRLAKTSKVFARKHRRCFR